MIVFTDLGRMVSIFFLCFLLIGYVHGSALMFTIALFCLAIIFVSTFLAWYALHGVKCRRKLPGSMTFSGDPFETTIELADESPRWRLLEIFDKHTNMITDQVTHRRMTVLLEGGTFDTASVNGTRYPMRHIKKDHRLANIPDTIRFPRRGHYRLGPLTLYSYDPFGLVYVQRALHEHDDVIVYPHPLPLPELIISGLNGRQTVDIGRAGHVGETADFHGIRPYVQGDDLRRVHWKSTAHSGKLAVKEFEYHSSGAMHLILDLQHGVHTGINDHATLEAAITLSTSLLNYVLEAGNRAGFLSTGEHLVSFAPESGQRQLHRILEALALANDNGKVSLAQALSSEDIAHSGHYATVVITPTVDKAIIGPLLSLRSRSTTTLLILLNPHSYQQASDAEIEKGADFRSRAKKLKRKIRFSQTAPRIPTEEEHLDLLHAITAAGIEVYPISAGVPLHQVLQGIRTRL